MNPPVEAGRRCIFLNLRSHEWRKRNQRRREMKSEAASEHCTDGALKSVSDVMQKTISISYVDV